MVDGTKATKRDAETQASPREDAETAAPDAVGRGSDAADAAGPPAVDAADRPKRGRPRKSAGAKAPEIELVLTATGNAEGSEWHADITHAGKRVVTALPVPASAVAAAAKDLHPDIATAIETVLSAARERQRSRVEQLQAELQAAERALADLQAG
jgi:uncharacterized protein DUF6319